MYEIPSEFIEFIRLGCNRLHFIQKYLQNTEIPNYVIQLDDKNHIVINLCSDSSSNKSKKLLIAHYDRVNGTPGANDNSSAVFCLLTWAIEQAKKKLSNNITIIFTDGEEQGQNGVLSQGAYQLAKHLKEEGKTFDEIFVFDCMGRGDVPFICLSSLTNKTSEEFKKKQQVLEEKAEQLLLKSTGSFMKLPTNYSDDAGFIANGIPAVVISMLPKNEAKSYQSCLKKMLLQKKNGMSADNHFYMYRPESWKLLHTMGDDISSLTPESFEIMHKILNEILKN